MGASAVWHPRRQPRLRAEDRVPTTDLDFAFYDHSTRGVGLYRINLGRAHTSTREEICAVIMAFLYESPLNIKVDNKVAVDAARKVIAAATLVKPFALLPNGDLLADLHYVAEGRRQTRADDTTEAPAETIRWCKGHADDIDIYEGKSTPEDRNGNWCFPCPEYIVFLVLSMKKQTKSSVPKGFPPPPPQGLPRAPRGSFWWPGFLLNSTCRLHHMLE